MSNVFSYQLEVRSSSVTDCKIYCKHELGSKKQLNSPSRMVVRGLMELPRHPEDRTGPATTTSVGRRTTVQSYMGTLCTRDWPLLRYFGRKRPVPIIEVEGDADWNIHGQFCDIVYPIGTQGWARLAVNVIGYQGGWQYLIYAFS